MCDIFLVTITTLIHTYSDLMVGKKNAPHLPQFFPIPVLSPEAVAAEK